MSSDLRKYAGACELYNYYMANLSEVDKKLLEGAAKAIAPPCWSACAGSWGIDFRKKAVGEV